MKQKKLLTKAVCFSAAFVMLLMSLTLEPGIALLNSWLRSSAEDGISEDAETSILTSDNGYEIVDSTEVVTIPTEVTFTWEEVSELSEEEVTPEPTTLSEADKSGSDNADQMGDNENSEGNSVVTEPGDESQLADEGDISSLNSAISDSKEYDSANYTSSSWKNFQNALSAANSILEDYNNNGTVLKNDVVNVINTIQSAIDDLVSIKELSELVIEAANLIESNYTSESFAAVSSNIKNANTVKENPAATQNEVNDAVNALRTAVESLVKKSYTLSWNSKYVTASYQNEESTVEIKNNVTQIPTGATITVKLTDDGEKIYDSIENVSFEVSDENRSKTISLNPKKTKVKYNFSEIKEEFCPEISFDNDSEVNYGQIIKVTPTTGYSINMTDSDGNEKTFSLPENESTYTYYIRALGVQSLTFTAVANSFDVTLIGDAEKYFKVDGTDKNGKASYGSTVTLTPNDDNCNGINVESLLGSVKVFDSDESNISESVGLKIGENKSVTFAMPASNVKISVTTVTPVKYSEITTENCTVETTTEENGAIEFNEGYAKFTVKPNDGYKIQEVKVNDKEVSPDDATGEINNIDKAQYTFSNDGIYSDVSVNATCEAVKYGEITSEYGTVEVTTDENDAIVFNEDGNATFTVTPKTSEGIGYIVKSVKVNGEEVSTKSVNKNGVCTVTFSNSGIHDDVNISVEYVVAVTLEINGTDGKSSTSVESNGNSVKAEYNYTTDGVNKINVMAQARTGFHIVSFNEEHSKYEDTAYASGANNESYYTKATKTYDDVSTWAGTKTITVTFAIDTFNITTEKSTGNGNGEVSVPKSPINYDNNSETTDATVTVTPNNDSYVSRLWCDNILIFSTEGEAVTSIDNISVNPEATDENDSINGSVEVAFNTVTADHTIKAEFSKIKEDHSQVNIDSDSSNLSINPQYSDNLGDEESYKFIVGKQGSSCTVNYTIPTGYKVYNFVGDCGDVSYSYSDGISTATLSIGTENQKVVFYLRNNSTYKVTKFTVTLVPDNEAPVIKGENECGKDSDGWVQETTFDVTVKDNPSEGKDDNSGIKTIKITADDIEDISFTDDDLTKGSSKDITTTDNETVGNVTPSVEYVDESETTKRISEVTLSFSFNRDYHGKITVSATDCADNKGSIDESIEVKNDVTAPKIKIEITQDILNVVDETLEDMTFGFYKPSGDLPLTITITVSDTYGKYTSEDDVSGVIKSITYSYKGREGKYSSTDVSISDTIAPVNENNQVTFKIYSDFRGTISVTASDYAGNDNTGYSKISDVYEENDVEFDGIVSDKTAPTRTVTYSTPKQVINAATLNSIEFNATSENANSILYYDGNAKLTLEIKEVNFYPEDVTVTVNDKSAKLDKAAWTSNGDVHTNTITLSGDGDYVVKVEYTDKSGNKMESYKSERIVIDTIDPIVKVEYDNNEVKNTVDERQYFNKQRTATITVTEHNFRADDIDVTVSAVDVTGSNVNVTDYHKYLLTRSSWTHNGDEHTATITYSTDANYTFDISYKDLALNESADYSEDKFTVDKNKPYELKVTYENEPVTKVGSTFYYDEQIHVTISAVDDISPIMRFEYWGDITDGVSAVNVGVMKTIVSTAEINRDRNVNTKDFYIPKEILGETNSFDGKVSFTAYDYAKNSSCKTGENRLVADKTAPQRTVTYSTPKQVVNATKLNSIEFNATSENANSILYYDDSATLTIAITEANFYAEDVHVYVNGEEVESLDKGKWSTSGDVHTNTITLSGDGDYVVKVEYTDKSGNVMTSYESEKIVIDTIDPIVKVEYDNNEVKNTVDERQYFDKQRTATITVTEHNFRADDIDVTVSAMDVTGKNVSVTDYSTYLSTRSNWTHNGDVHTATITYSTDANYTFDISYKDLALNESADYSEDKFTVDKNKPYDLKVTYENDPENTVGSTRYYGEQVHVMISAVDDTSPIYQFEYEGKLTQDDPISAVNRGVLQTIIESKSSEITREGNVNKVDFYIPKELLNENNSFDGNVYFIAYDCAENNTDITDATRLVTDKIAPTATVTFNGSEYTEKEYFNTNIDVNISINEANFNSNDVIVSVTKDDNSYSGYSVNWTDSSIDSHLGSFTLTEDGDYVVNVKYTDKSGNKMQDYTSPVIVLDTVNPVVEIDQINGESAHESAHNDETIGIKVSVTDKNIAESGVKLKLTAITNKSTGGTYSPDTKDITFVEPIISEDKTVLTYSIDNLEMDGYYTLTCNATDLASNENVDETGEKHIIADGNVKVEEINFSVNRNGSVFYIEATRDGKPIDDINNKLNNQYLNAKVSVTFHEINVAITDKDITQKTLIKDNKEISDPKVDYSNDEIGSGGWYERKYTYHEDNFEDDGSYTLRITTTDKAGNVNDSSTDDKSSALSFTIDRTAPVIYSNVVEEQIDDGKYQGKTINKAEQTVEISFAEPNLDVEKLRIVRVDGENEEEIGDNDNLEIDENNVVTFSENNILNDNIKVYAYDLAGNESTYDIVDLTVTTNVFALWYANTFIFWLSIIIFVVLAGLFILFIILKKRKKSEDDE